MDGLSTNQLEYKEHELTPRESFKPENNYHRPEVPFDHKTTAAEDFYERSIEPRRRHAPEAYQKPEGEIDFNTVNKTNFTEKATPRETLIRPESSHIMDRNAQFDAHTNYGSDFKSHDVRPREVVNRNNSYHPPEVEMDTRTTNKSDFFQHEITPRQTFKPLNTYEKPDVPFDGTTGYKHDFVGHDIPIRQARQQVQYNPPSVKFEGNTTQSDSFKGEFAPKPKSYKPSGEPYQSGVPLEGTTTAKRDFKEHKVEPRKARVHQEYKTPEGKMDLRTSNQQDFTEKTSPRQEINRPESSHIMARNANFDGFSRYNADFVSHEIKPREVVNRRSEYQPPAVEFEKQTTNRMAFVGHAPQPRESYKPSAALQTYDTPFDGKTGYSDTFVSHKIEPKALKPKPEYTAPVTKFSGNTTTNDSYKGEFVPKQQSYKPKGEPFNSGVPFESQTTARNDFHAHKVERRRIHEHQPYSKPEGVMDLTTTNQHNFTPKESPRQAVVKPGSSGVMRREGQFEGSTTNRNAFVQHTIPPRQNFKPDNAVQPSKEPFIKSTGYRETFKEHHLPEKFVKPKDEYTSPKAPFEGKTTTQQDFTTKTGSKRDTFKPAQNTSPSGVPFDGTTTARKDFEAWPVERRQGRRREEYVKPEGSMDMRTVNSENFKMPGGSGRQVAKRPTSSGILKYDGKIDGRTNYNSDFLKPEGAERPSRRDPAPYVPSTEPFLGQSTHRSEFITHGQARSTSFKPDPIPFSSNAKFDNSTTYGADFTKSLPPWMKDSSAPPIRVRGTA